MTEAAGSMPRAPAAASERPVTAGAALRQARLAQGVQIEALSAAIKVVPRKLEALEADRYEQLTDATFTRALAKTVCRHLKIDPAPVLAMLPPMSGPQRLEQVAEGLNTPFRERSERLVPREWARVTTPAVGLALLIVLATLGLYLFPAHWRPLLDAGATRSSPSEGSAASTTGVAASPEVASVPPVETAPSAPASSPPPSGEPTVAAATAAVPVAGASAVPAESGSGIIRLQASAPSWVEVVDANRKTLISRALQAGEDVSFEGPAPFKVKIGNVHDTRMTVRGEPFDLVRTTKDNVARLEIK